MVQSCFCFKISNISIYFFINVVINNYLTPSLFHFCPLSHTQPVPFPSFQGRMRARVKPIVLRTQFATTLILQCRTESASVDQDMWPWRQTTTPKSVIQSLKSWATPASTIFNVTSDLAQSPNVGRGDAIANWDLITCPSPMSATRALVSISNV